MLVAARFISVKTISARRHCAGSRSYFKDTAPLIDYYRDRGTLVTVNGDQSVDDVRRDLSAAVGKNGA